MEPMTIALIASAVLGAKKSQEHQAEARRQQGIEAVKEKWAPFTGRAGKTVARPSQIDPILQSMLAGASIGQQFQGGGGGTANGASSGMGDAGIPGRNASSYNPQYQQQVSQEGFPQYAQDNYFRPYGAGGQ